jgi:ribonuclease P protein component
MPPHGFSKAQRVRRKAEFQHVFDGGTRVSSRFFTLLVARHPGPSTSLGAGPSTSLGTGPVARLGLVASRKLGDAIRRNRAKRVIREVFRLNQPLHGGAGVDLVVIPRRELCDAPFTDIEKEFRGAWRRAVARLPATDAR